MIECVTNKEKAAHDLGKKSWEFAREKGNKARDEAKKLGTGMGPVRREGEKRQKKSIDTCFKANVGNQKGGEDIN